MAGQTQEIFRTDCFAYKMQQLMHAFFSACCSPHRAWKLPPTPCALPPFPRTFHRRSQRVVQPTNEGERARGHTHNNNSSQETGKEHCLLCPIPPPPAKNRIRMRAVWRPVNFVTQGSQNPIETLRQRGKTLRYTEQSPQ